MGDLIHLWRECAVCSLWFKPTRREDTMHPDCAAHQNDERAAAAHYAAEAAPSNNLAALPAGAPKRLAGHSAHTRIIDEGVSHSRADLEAKIKAAGAEYPTEYLDDEDKP
jgi:hypothetical protein